MILHYNLNSTCFFNGKEILFKFTVDNKNVNFSTQCYLRSISSGFDATESLAYLEKKMCIIFRWGGEGGACGFSKNVSSRDRDRERDRERERVKPSFFVIFSIIISHIFLQNFIDISRAILKMWRFSPLVLTIFITFLVFLYFLVTKKRMTSAYNWWCQHFFRLNLL